MPVFLSFFTAGDTQPVSPFYKDSMAVVRTYYPYRWVYLRAASRTLHTLSRRSCSDNGGEKAREEKRVCYARVGSKSTLGFTFQAETHIFWTGIAAYAHAAAGPEYEYPACLPHRISTSTHAQYTTSHGPIKALHRSIGGW
jgi:hypothetical protein